MNIITNNLFLSSQRVFRRLLYEEPSLSQTNKKPKKKALYRPNSDGYVDKTDFRGQPTLIVQDFEPEVFKQLMEYIHSGSVMLQSRTLLGLMNAADHYGLDELKMACVQFLDRAINTDTVCALLSSAEKYIQYKSTKILVQKMLEFVDQHAEVVLNLGSFATLPQHVVRIILGREELLASEETKFEAAFRWCLRFIDDHPDLDLKTAFEPFVSQIAFHRISANHLMKKVKPAQVVDDAVILTALAYQADPSSIDSNKLNVKQRPVLTSSTTSSNIPTLESSPPHIRRVQSSGIPMRVNIDDIDDDSTDSRLERGSSVPPPSNNHQPDLQPSRVFETRTDSRASELSLSSTTDSTTSLSSVPRSPLIGRSASSSSYLSNLSPDTEGKKYSNISHTESYVTLSSTSVEV